MSRRPRENEKKNSKDLNDNIITYIYIYICYTPIYVYKRCNILCAVLCVCSVYNCGANEANGIYNAHVIIIIIMFFRRRSGHGWMSTAVRR